MPGSAVAICDDEESSEGSSSGRRNADIFSEKRDRREGIKLESSGTSADENIGAAVEEDTLGSAAGSLCRNEEKGGRSMKGISTRSGRGLVTGSICGRGAITAGSI